MLAAPRQTVWLALNDTNVLANVIPGCEKITWRDAASLDLAVRVNLGVMHPVFTGELELSEVDPAVSYILSGRAHGKLLGKAGGAARITLADAGPDTVLAFKAEGKASERLLALGRPLVGNSVQRVIDRFFQRFADVMQVELTPIESPPTRPEPER